MRWPRLFAVAFTPHKAMREILDRGPASHREIITLVLATFLSSVMKDIRVPDFLDFVERTGSGMTLALAVPVILASAIVSIGVFYVFAWGGHFAGRFFDGEGSRSDVRTALAWGFAPVILALVYRLPLMLFGPRRILFRSEDGTINLGATGPGSLAFGVLDALFLCWYLFVASSALAEAQNVSSWAGLGNLLLAWVLPFIAIAAIVAAAVLSFMA